MGSLRCSRTCHSKLTLRCRLPAAQADSGAYDRKILRAEPPPPSPPQKKQYVETPVSSGFFLRSQYFSFVLHYVNTWNRLIHRAKDLQVTRLTSFSFATAVGDCPRVFFRRFTIPSKKKNYSYYLPLIAAGRASSRFASSKIIMG